jgi:hypothetical protein
MFDVLAGVGQLAGYVIKDTVGSDREGMSNITSILSI